MVREAEAVARERDALVLKERRAAERAVEVEMVKPAVEAVFMEEVAAGETADEVTGAERGETDDAIGGGVGVVGVGVGVGEKAIEMEMVGKRGEIRTVVGGGEEGGAEEREEIGKEREEEERERMVGEVIELCV
ncbi:hypothetical protein Csa_008164 [Cucumis sativus]|uniref:Uncharacterized protein n=1 Tax=Cucumis sativus TaxID=3659 RepID=A0A0A0KUZ6_CUCSA|nr:hypothetical protein Csa_008164 [Cucumis sativus]